MIFYCTANFSATARPAWIDDIQKIIPAKDVVLDVGSGLPETLFNDMPEIDPKLTPEQLDLLGLDLALLLPRADVMKRLEYGELGLHTQHIAFRDLYWLIRSDYVFADFSNPGFGQALYDITLAGVCRIPVIAINTRTHVLAHVINRAFAVITPDNVKSFVVQLLSRR